MSFEQTKDVIERARLFHRQLRDYYLQLKEVTDKQRVQMLLDYLCLHEEKMERSLSEFEQSTTRGALSTWFMYAPGDETEKVLKSLRIDPDMTSQEVVCTALQLDETLLRLYKQAAELAPREPIRELFRSMYEEGKKERSKLVLNLFEPQ